MTPVPAQPFTVRATAAKRSFPECLRLNAATAVGDLAALASRVLGRGSGASIRGQLLTRINPASFRQLLAGRRIIAVTGTNGKTTSTHFIAKALREALGSEAERLVHNADGANLRYGIASALTKARRADLAVLEVDERVIPDLIAQGRPEIVVMLNFSRDQLDRNFEIKFLAQAWRDALEAAGDQGPIVVANSDDPLITWVAEKAREVVWVDTAATWSADATLCPECGTILSRREPEGDGTGAWDCPGCPLTEHQASYFVEGNTIRQPDGRVVETKLNVPGKFNVANAACALAALHLWGVETDVALQGFRMVQAPAGRFATVQFGDVAARLLLAKNPAGWAEALRLLRTDTLIMAIDAIAADGNDPSWLWDVDYEQLAGRQIVITGPRAYDLATRLAYAEVDYEVVLDLDAALKRGAELRGAPSTMTDPIDVVTTYTPFQQLLKMGGLR